MDRKGIGIIAAAIVVGAAILGLSQALAQREFRTEPREANSQTPRYQVANVTEGEIILLDVVTGDLYSAKPRDVKPYDSRLRTGDLRNPARAETTQRKRDYEDMKRVPGPEKTDTGKRENFKSAPSTEKKGD